jgi:transcriptional regulator with XRE-family HTH domain
MARAGLTLADVVQRSGLDERTVKGVLSGGHNPHPRTLHRLAAGLDVPADELFQNPSLLAHRLFDRATNPLVDEVIAERPELFADWREADFDELYSRFGTGGALTFDGAVESVAAMNRKRAVHGKVALLMETAQAELLENLVEVLYQRVVVPTVEQLEQNE